MHNKEIAKGFVAHHIGKNSTVDTDKLSEELEKLLDIISDRQEKVFNKIRNSLTDLLKSVV